ncbi:MAG: LON peptidase substrate-binding domain-containing protein, partial [Acidimicrobiia bacterium]|nr:LON peptidase substrate-binding domain-containing protein [Acidimicrobiia bacterium]
MPDHTTLISLPVLPLRNGVVFPHMVVTLSVDSDEGKTAVGAAASAGSNLLLVPHINGSYATVGTIAEVQTVAEGAGVVVRGVARARVGAGRTSEDGALWVE